ncbi:hypothetical protein Tco_0053005 [Tanacetum coccineum]
MYYDNTGAIAIANESGITKGARHLCAKVHYLHEVIEFGDIKLEKVHTDENLADPFTKAWAFPKHSELTRNIRMLPASSLISNKGRSQVQVPPGTFTSSGAIGGSTGGFKVQHTAQLDVTAGPEPLTTKKTSSRNKNKQKNASKNSVMVSNVINDMDNLDGEKDSRNFNEFEENGGIDSENDVGA